MMPRFSLLHDKIPGLKPRAAAQVKHGFRSIVLSRVVPTHYNSESANGLESVLLALQESQLPLTLEVHALLKIHLGHNCILRVADLHVVNQRRSGRRALSH